MTVAELFQRVSERLLADDPGLERSRMFASDGLKTHGKFFAFQRGDDLVLKVPAERVRELISAGPGRPFESGNRVMKEWVVVRPADEPACAAYLEEARSFVAARQSA